MKHFQLPTRRQFLAGAATAAVAAYFGTRHNDSAVAQPGIGKVAHTDAEWRKLLTANQYYILRQSGTEQPFDNAYWNNEAVGDYFCAGCDLLLFHSSTKFDSGTGWPSFYEPATKESVVTREDDSFLMQRTEVRCARCDGHLGHVFDDGPPPTGLRYCMNSGAMNFVPKK